MGHLDASCDEPGTRGIKSQNQTVLRNDRGWKSRRIFPRPPVSGELFPLTSPFIEQLTVPRSRSSQSTLKKTRNICTCEKQQRHVQGSIQKQAAEQGSEKTEAHSPFVHYIRGQALVDEIRDCRRPPKHPIHHENRNEMKPHRTRRRN